MISPTNCREEQRAGQDSSLFERLGNAFHLLIEDFSDLRSVLELDEAHWVATTAPLSTINADPVLLGYVDADGDGRIRAEEIKDAIRFLFAHHAMPEQIRPGNFSLPVAAISARTDLGSQMRGSAQKVLKRLDAEEDVVHLPQVRQVKHEVLEGGLDQAGIVLVEAARTKEEGTFIADLLATVGGSRHPCGKEGVDAVGLERFLGECLTRYAWLKESGVLGVDGAKGILPLGDATEGAYAVFQRMHHKCIQFFLLCDIKRLNPALIEQALQQPEVNPALNLMDIQEAETFLANAPLAPINREGQLQFDAEVNPYFRKDLLLFQREVVTPLLGDSPTLNRQELRELAEIFRPYAEWMERKPDDHLDILDVDRVAAYACEERFNQGLEELISQSHQTAFVLENLRELERLLLYQGWILPLVNSFVSFPHLYEAESRALFEMGTLVMDGRHFTMAVRVDDRQQHIEAAKASNIFIIYLELFGVDGEKTCEVAVPVTSGSRGNLRLGKWGIFNDIHGNELHAHIVDIVENPISVVEAMIDPFMRIGHAFVSRLEEFSSKAEERLFRQGKSDAAKKKEGSGGGFLAGGGIAAAALGSSFAFITQTLAGLSLKVIIISILVTVLLITLPAAVATYYRLSRRDLSTVLEGAGWGLNARMRLTGIQAQTFTLRPPYRGVDK